jgi:hypothetical protein
MYCPNRITYVIQPGDTLYRLARAYDTTIHSLRNLNPGLNPTNLRIGQSITICPGARYVTTLQPMPPPTPGPGLQEPEYIPPLIRSEWPPLPRPEAPAPQPEAVAPMPPPAPQPEAVAPMPPPAPQPEAVAPMPPPAPQPEGVAPMPPPTPRPVTPPPVPMPSPRPVGPSPEPAPLFEPRFDDAPAPVPMPSPRPPEGWAPPDQTPQTGPCMGDTLSLDAHDLYQDMRTAWQHQALCTHLFGLSMAEGLGDTEVAAQRLMDSGGDILDIFTHYYGPEVGRALEGLLSEQAALSRDVLAATAAEGVDAAQPVDDRWRGQGAYMAQYLAAVNPHYDERELAALIHDQQDLTRQCLYTRMAGDWSAHTEATDCAMAQSRRLADYLARGIVAQFPNTF